MPDLLDPGEPAPEFELIDIHGRPVHRLDYRGKPVLLAFLRGFL
jgi:peroxiredoxin